MADLRVWDNAGNMLPNKTVQDWIDFYKAQGYSGNFFINKAKRFILPDFINTMTNPAHQSHKVSGVCHYTTVSVLQDSHPLSALCKPVYLHMEVWALSSRLYVGLLPTVSRLSRTVV